MERVVYILGARGMAERAFDLAVPRRSGFARSAIAVLTAAVSCVVALPARAHAADERVARPGSTETTIGDAPIERTTPSIALRGSTTLPLPARPAANSTKAAAPAPTVVSPSKLSPLHLTSRRFKVRDKYGQCAVA